MPNWVHCWLTVEGDNEAVSGFVEKVREPESVSREVYETTIWIGEPKTDKPPFEEWLVERAKVQPLSFAVHVPMPSSIGDGWYDWNVRNWGTKWDASFGGAMMGLGEEGMDMTASQESSGVQGPFENGDRSSAVFCFDTAWSPPLPWLKKCSEQESQLAFGLRWADASSGSHMQLRFVGGLVVEQEDLEYEDVAPEWRWF